MPALQADCLPMSTVRELADRFHESWLAENPFAASTMGVPGYDDKVPDASAEGRQRRRAEVEAALQQSRALAEATPQGAPWTPADAITLACVTSAAEVELAAIDAAPGDFTVTAMPLDGPPSLLAVLARTTLPGPEAASEFLARLRASGRWVDQVTEQLGTGAAKGRFPVAPLVRQAIDWAEAMLGQDVPDAITTPEAPAAWDGATAWADERDRLAREVVKPALARWAEQLRTLLPSSRPPERAGLVYLDGGEADYANAVLSHTTLPVTADQLYRTGEEEIARLEDRARELGTVLGLASLEDVHQALRAAAAQAEPAEAMAAAVNAIRRAEEAAPSAFPPPLPAPCDVSPMPNAVALSGIAPHYTRPRLDIGRPGTYWFNTERPTAGTGWDLESVAFHEAVPGHHLHLARIQLLDHLPGLQRERSVTVCSEGWALYAEQLSEEMGLYSTTEALLGAITAQLMRAARLVVDTGLHWRGWSRQQALAYFVAHVPMPESFLANEIDRYIAWPGQALAYLSGKLEILRLRRQAQETLGEKFSLSSFHGAIIDVGSVPMPVLQEAVGAWTEVAAEAQP